MFVNSNRKINNNKNTNKTGKAEKTGTLRAKNDLDSEALQKELEGLTEELDQAF